MVYEYHRYLTSSYAANLDNDTNGFSDTCEVKNTKIIEENNQFINYYTMYCPEVTLQNDNCMKKHALCIKFYWFYDWSSFN